MCSHSFRIFCILQDLPSKNLIGVGRHRDGLYCLEPIMKVGVAMSMSIDSKIWHKRLGHDSDLKLPFFDGFYNNAREHVILV